MGIFKAFDVRGKFEEEISEDFAYVLGQAFVELTGVSQVVVGRDTRLSSPALAARLVEGLVSVGVKVIDIGLVSSGQWNFAVAHFGYEAGIMVTASHSTKEYNGFKPCLKNAIPLTRVQVQEWKALVEKGRRGGKEGGRVEKKDISEEYFSKVKSLCTIPYKKLKVVMDGSNAMAGPLIEPIFGNTNLEIVPLNTKLDGSCPAHEVDPKMPANRKMLVDAVLEHAADFGIIWDGDADRVQFVSKDGLLLDPNFAIALMAQYMVKKSDKKKVIVEVRTSRVVEDEVMKVGGNVLVIKCWHSETKLALRENPDAVMGSELSGHIMFSDFYNIDDAVVAAVMFLQAVSAQEDFYGRLSQLRERYFIQEEVNFPYEKKEDVKRLLSLVEKHFASAGGEANRIDGLTMRFKDWKFNLRTSETTNLLRLNLEASSHILMEEKSQEIADLLK